MGLARRFSVALVVAFVSLVAASVEARQSPDQRACRIAGGQPWVLPLENDDIELCRFGAGAVGSRSFYLATILSQQPAAVLVFKQHPAFHGCAYSCDAEIQYCSQVGGSLIVAQDSDQVTFRVCQFSDESAIELGSLFRGPKDASNRLLVQALAGQAN